MQSILQALYSGGLSPQAMRDYPLPWESFCACLKDRAPELEKQLSILMENINEIYITDTEEMFLQGFSLAVKLFAEGLAY